MHADASGSPALTAPPSPPSQPEPGRVAPDGPAASTQEPTGPVVQSAESDDTPSLDPVTQAVEAATHAGEAGQPPRFRRIAVIANPAAGQDQPVLGILNRAFHLAGVDWEIFVTKKAGDARRYTKRAVAEEFDAVAVYGGDGTVGEVASGLVGSKVPLAILPGGTANVMSMELGIPTDLAQACALACSGSAELRSIDVGMAGDTVFMLRIGIGLEASMVDGADREFKDRLGTLAYALSALQALREPAVSRYTLTLDGRPFESEGISCIVANSGNIGRPGYSLAPNIDVDDGLLDVLIIRSADIPSLIALAASVISGREQDAPLQHWQAHEVTVETTPPQTVTIDGEIVNLEPVQARVVHHALRVIVPPS